jgi:hypothetical protein
MVASYSVESKDKLMRLVYTLICGVVMRKENHMLENYQPSEEKCDNTISLRVPRSLHQFLLNEAKTEGVSIKKIIITKIAISLYDKTEAKDKE